MKQAKDIFGKVHVTENTCIAGLLPVVLLLLCCFILGLSGDALTEKHLFSVGENNDIHKIVNKPVTDYARPGAVAGLVCVINIRTLSLRHIIFRLGRIFTLGLSSALMLFYMLFCAMWRFLSRYYIKAGLKRESPLAINIGGHAPPFG